MKFFRNILLPILIAAPRFSSAETLNTNIDAGAWKLLPQAQVDSSGVFLDQLVESAVPTRTVPHIRLARAPQAGQAASFSRSEIAGVAQACVAGLVMTNWTGAETSRVSRRIRILDDADLVNLLTDTLQRGYIKNQGEVELHLTRPWVKPQVPDEPLTLKISQMPSRGLSSSSLITFELWDAKDRVGSWQVQVQASVWRDVPIANTTLMRGDLVKGADVTMTRTDVLTVRDTFENFANVDDTMEFKENVQAGRPILSRSVRVRPLILRGQMVEAVYQDGALGISLTVETLEDGSLGQTVRVRNPKTRRELFGKVINEKTVSITL